MDERDHDVLVETRTIVKTLCIKVDKLSDKMDNQTALCSSYRAGLGSKIDEVKDKKVEYKIFQWITGVIFLVILAMVGYMSLQTRSIMSNSAHILIIEKAYEIKVEPPIIHKEVIE